MISFLVALAVGFNVFVGFYYGLVNVVYSVLLALALVAILKHVKRIKYSSRYDFSSSPETPPVSVVIPAYNEEGDIVESVKSALSLNYPYFEVIVVNDGSSDGTLRRLVDSFGLRRIDLVYRDVIKTEKVRGFHYSVDFPNLIVVDKERGGKSDSLNCGVNIARSPYFCSVDADSVLERDSLLRLVAPMLESTVPVIASGGVIRAINGCTLEHGEVKKVDLPENDLAMFQIVEYLRAFLFGRVGLDVMNAVLILSGAFSLFSRAAIIEVGGYSRKNVSEDMELVVKLRKHFKKKKRPYKIKFISDPICWTEVPENLRMLGRQRRRWHLGLMQSIIQHRSVLFNPAYGKLGLIVMPYYLLVEMLSPFVEVFGYIVVVMSFFLHIISAEFFLLFLILAVFYGIFLSTAGVFLEELTYKRYPKWGHLAKLLLFGIFENFGYRQLNSFWRVQAAANYFMGKRQWEYVMRSKNH